MTIKEKEILNIIKSNPTIEQNEIAKILNIKRSTVAVHISSLQKKGYILGKGYLLKNDDYIVGIGACNVDIYGKSLINLQTYYDHPAKINSSVGGVMYNIIANFVKLGGNAKLITAYSDDIYGKYIVEHCKNKKIDISESLFIKGQNTNMFIQVQDKNNDLYLALCDMSILNDINSDFILSKKNIILNSKLVVIDPSLNIDSIKKLIEICKEKVPIYMDPISENYTKKIKPFISNFELIKPNKKELEILINKKINNDHDLINACNNLIKKGLKRIVVSLGKDGLLYVDESHIIKRKVKEEKKIVNASGAGDALMATLLYGELNDIDLDKRIDYALAAGAAALRSKETIIDDLSIELLENILEEKKK